jgi:hypothetical protein
MAKLTMWHLMTPLDSRALSSGIVILRDPPPN